METTVEILNKIANKLGDENADHYTTVAQALGSIANALGNSDPDKIQTVPEALQEILAVAGGGGGTPKAFGVDLLQISVPFGKYELSNQIVLPMGTMNTYAMPSLNGYLADLQSIFAWEVEATGSPIPGVALIMSPTKDEIALSDAAVSYQEGLAYLGASSDQEVFFIWYNGNAYLASPTLDNVENGWEFFLYKENPLA